MRRVAAVLAVVAFALVATAAPAAAIIDGNCNASLNGIDVRGLPVDDPDVAIKVKETDQLVWSVSSSVPLRSRNIVMSYAGVDVTVDSGSSGGEDGGSRGGAVVVEDFAWMGAGLYQVAGVGRFSDGSVCSGAVLIDVEGNPLTTVAGVTGAILTILGGAGIIAAIVRRSGGRGVRELIDLIELSGVGDDTGDGATVTKTPPPPPKQEPVAPPVEDEVEEPPAEEPPPEKPPRRKPPVPATPPVEAAEPPVPPAPPVQPAPPVAPPASAPADAPAEDAPKPPPLPGMEAVGTIGTTAEELAKAKEQLDGYIDDLPATDEQKEKLKEHLGLDKIAEHLETVKGTVETVQHFEAMGTETVDTMNRWGVNSNGINGLLWLRTMMEASGRLTQKFVDGLVTPVIEPVTEAAGKVGVEADAEEIAHTLLPVQETAEEASKALLNAGKNVLGGDNILNQLGQDPVVDEEWRNIRTFP